MILFSINKENILFVGLILVLLILIIAITISIIKENKRNKKRQIVKEKLEKEKELEVQREKDMELAKIELEKVVKQMEDNSKQERISTYEEDQEDRAIITYQELLNASKGIKEEHQDNFSDIKDNYTYDDSINIDIIEEDIIPPSGDNSITIDIEEEINNIDNIEPVENEIDTSDIRSLLREKSLLKVDEPKIEEKDITYGKSRNTKEFHNSEFISPIHGTKEFKGDYYKKTKEINEEVEILEENPLNFDDISDKIKTSVEFLNLLKELRDKL